MTGFIAVACEQCSEPLIDDVRATVRACPYGLLVMSGCLLGQTFCRSRASLTGGVMMVQPCAADQRPTGPATLFGPLRAATDVSVVCDWLRRGLSGTSQLPARLFGMRTRVSQAPLN